MRFAPHRHDAYAIGITLRGVQSFGYRGTTLHSEAGCAFVIHPDETHDGRAGTDEGFGYRILYIAPRLISEALGSRTLPFVRDAVTRRVGAASRDLRGARCFRCADRGLAASMTSSHALPTRSPHTIRRRSGFLQRPRAPCGSRVTYLDDACDLPSSATLERLTGLSRFELARQFRKCLGTSPHRYATMRRLERARQLIGAGASLAEAATACGFADQSHMTRQFKQAYGVAPGAMARADAALTRIITNCRNGDLRRCALSLVGEGISHVQQRRSSEG